LVVDDKVPNISIFLLQLLEDQNNEKNDLLEGITRDDLQV
jgi:hypothetical protein